MRERASRRPSPSSGSGCRPARRRGSRRTGRGRRCRPAPAQWSRRSPEASDRHRSNEIRAGHVDPVSGRHDAARPLRPRPSPARGRAAIQGRVPPPRGLPRRTGRRRPARPARGPALPRAGSSSGQLFLGPARPREGRPPPHRARGDGVGRPRSRPGRGSAAAGSRRAPPRPAARPRTRRRSRARPHRARRRPARSVRIRGEGRTLPPACREAPAERSSPPRLGSDPLDRRRPGHEIAGDTDGSEIAHGTHALDAMSRFDQVPRRPEPVAAPVRRRSGRAPRRGLPARCGAARRPGGARKDAAAGPPRFAAASSRPRSAPSPPGRPRPHRESPRRRSGPDPGEPGERHPFRPRRSLRSEGRAGARPPPRDRAKPGARARTLSTGGAALLRPPPARLPAGLARRRASGGLEMRTRCSVRTAGGAASSAERRVRSPTAPSGTASAPQSFAAASSRPSRSRPHRFDPRRSRAAEVAGTTVAPDAVPRRGGRFGRPRPSSGRRLGTAACAAPETPRSAFATSDPHRLRQLAGRFAAPPTARAHRAPIGPSSLLARAPARQGRPRLGPSAALLLRRGLERISNDREKRAPLAISSIAEERRRVCA